MWTKRNKDFDSREGWWQASAPLVQGCAAILRERGLVRTDLGEKQVCPSCGAKFYDLRRRPAVCPKCTTSFDPSEEGVRARRTRSRVTSHDPAYDEDDDTEERARPGAGGDDEEEEAEDTPEVDAEAEAEPLLSTDDEEEEAAPSGDDLPEGFSEEEADLGEDSEDGVPMLEDEEEFSEDEIGEIPGGDDEDGGR
jgi:uncharacterized protein (TIGR02300 family)